MRYLVFSAFVLLALTIVSCHNSAKKQDTTAFKRTDTIKAPVIDSVSDSIEVPDDTIGNKILSLIFVREDEKAHKTESEVFIFGQCLGGDYVPMYDSINMVDYPSIRYRILQKYKDWTLFMGSRPLADITLNKIDTEEYACERDIVGFAPANNIDTVAVKRREAQFVQSLNGSSNGKDIEYRQTVFFAINGKPSEFKVSVDTGNTFSAQLSGALKDNIVALYRKHSGMAIFDIHRNSVSPITIKGEQYFLSVSSCSDSVKELASSMVYLFQVKDNKIVSRDTLFEDMGTSSWGDGFTLLDAEDINSDGNIELIFMVDGYEVTGVELLEITDNKFKQVLATELFGC